MRLEWNGGAVRAKVATSSARATDKTMALCVADAKANHPSYPPPSEPHQRYANRPGAFNTGSIQIIEVSGGIAGAAIMGAGTVGRWGALSRYSLFLEIGTSIRGANATARMQMASAAQEPFDPALVEGWPGVPGPEGPKMAPRPFLRPAADRHYPLLATRIGEDFRGEEMR